MQAIFNKHGYTVGWLSGKDLYNLKGNFIGFLKGNAVYNNSSQYCGTLKQSFFRDYSGYVVAFLSGAKNSPALPSFKVLPSKPTKKQKLANKVAPPSPSTKPPKPSWSKLDWEIFIQ